MQGNIVVFHNVLKKKNYRTKFSTSSISKNKSKNIIFKKKTQKEKRKKKEDNLGKKRKKTKNTCKTQKKGKKERQKKQKKLKQKKHVGKATVLSPYILEYLLILHY